MRNSRNNIILVLVLTVILLTASCNREPVVPPQPVTEQISIADLKSLYKGTDITLDTNVFIQGIVTLTPELNNIPDFIGYIQDETGAVTLTITGNNTLAVGSELKIYCTGLTLTDYRGLLQFGDVDLATQSELINISATMPDPELVTIAQLLNGEFIARYIEIESSQFVESGTFSGGKTLTDCTSEIEVYTRSSATFSGSALPAGNGSFKGVVSVYDDPQLIIREPSELVMDGERCGSSTGYLNETFESLAGDAPIDNLAGWKNISEKGTQKWIADNYSNKSAVMSAYSTSQAEVITWMITPTVNISSAVAPVLTFESKARYDNGAELEVFVSTDYTGGTTPWTSSWTKLNPALDPGSAGGSSNWVSSGNVDLSAYKGQTSIAFKYTGGDPGATTTWQVDNVVITDNGK